jgi:predicted nucleic acid-binding protein
MSASEGQIPLVFADTNIWLYALLEIQDAEKSAKAKAIIRQQRLVASVQLINEICVNLLKKAHFSEQQVRELVISFYERHAVIPIEREVLLKASILRERYGFSYWDSTMVASALTAGAQVFYTEDMHHGLLVESVMRLENPLRTLA